MTDNPTVELTPELQAACERAIENTTFGSVDEYIQFVLSEVVAESASDSDSTTDRPERTAEQLEALGYLDR
jgi:Arc/MetJ-type ribon-helix-helix transcriptional regulator